MTTEHSSSTCDVGPAAAGSPSSPASSTIPAATSDRLRRASVKGRTPQIIDCTARAQALGV
jgi:hypothetical protein